MATLSSLICEYGTAITSLVIALANPSCNADHANKERAAVARAKEALFKAFPSMNYPLAKLTGDGKLIAYVTMNGYYYCAECAENNYTMPIVYIDSDGFEDCCNRCDKPINATLKG